MSEPRAGSLSLSGNEFQIVGLVSNGESQTAIRVESTVRCENRDEAVKRRQRLSEMVSEVLRCLTVHAAVHQLVGDPLWHVQSMELTV